MFGAFAFGQGYFAQGPLGVSVVVSPPAVADVILVVAEDVGTILMPADVTAIEP